MTYCPSDNLTLHERIDKVFETLELNEQKNNIEVFLTYFYPSHKVTMFA